MDTLKWKIMESIRELGGFLPISPKTKAETIQKTFGVRKKDFVAAVSSLEEEGQIETTPGGIQTKVESTPGGRMFRQIRRKRR